MTVVTIIPAYNEEKSIAKVVKTSLKYSEVMVIDDGSEDKTFQMAKTAGAMIIQHSKNLGKGAALKAGLHFALDKKYDEVILIDGDCQHDPDYIPILISHLNNADLIIGSRFTDGSPGNMPFQRKLSNRLTTFIMHHLTGYHLTDSQSGFRALKSQSVALFLDIEYEDYIYESEMLYKAYKNDLNVEEVSISCIYGDEKSNIASITAMNYLWFVFKRIFKKTKRRLFR
jgi:glycosyltransferase involved in cell wall biosynthesis